MHVDPRQVESLTKLLYWLGGIAIPIVGSWVASKIPVYHDNRKSHHDDLKQKVLCPLRNGLQTRYADLLAHRAAGFIV